jgi:hypothetical protein
MANTRTVVYEVYVVRKQDGVAVKVASFLTLNEAYVLADKWLSTGHGARVCAAGS